MTISIFGNPILRAKGARVSEITPELLEFADRMIELMREARGIGLAAQQAGRAVQMCVVDVSEVEPEAAGKIEIGGEEADLAKLMPMVLINPDIEPVGRKRDVYEEGCLSFPGVTGEVTRPVKIRVRAMDRSGEALDFVAEGLVARVIQHEHDHLHGILFIDRMSAAQKAALSGKLKRLKKSGEEQARGG